jgi:hypothetical protein
LPIKVIARVLGISKNTVKAAWLLTATEISKATAWFDRREVEPRIRELL